MSSAEEKDKRQVSKDSPQSPNPAKAVNAPKLSVKHEFTLDTESSGKKKTKNKRRDAAAKYGHRAPSLLWVQLFAFVTQQKPVFEGLNVIPLLP